MDNTKTPAALEAAELTLQVTDATKDYVVLRVWPKVEAVHKRLAAMGYTCRHYCCRNVIYCGVGTGGERYRDACAITAYRVTGDAGQDECDSSFLAAAAKWGVGDAVLRVPGVRLDSDKVQINPVPSPDGKSIRGYTLGERLAVEAVTYEGGEVSALQIAKADGGKLVWQRH